ncbi:unnamed protein product, partial [Phaeothamnion confervicola]
SWGALEWIVYSDLLETRIGEEQDYSFGRYASAAAAGVHTLCRVATRPPLAMPRRDFEVSQERQRKLGILRAFMDGMALGSGCRGTSEVALDLLSCLCDIVAPPLRPVNPDLLTPIERQTLQGLVSVLLSCGLTFAPAPAAAAGPAPWVTAVAWAQQQQGMVEYLLEPGVHQLVTYAGHSYCHKMLSNTARQTVAHEVKLEAMRRAEARANRDSGGGAAAAGGARRGTKRPTEDDRNGGSGEESAAAAEGKAAAAATAAVVAASAAEEDRCDKKARRSAAVPFWNRTNAAKSRLQGKTASGGGDGRGSGSGSKGAA